VAGVVLLAGGGIAFAQTQGGSGSYRTATVTRGDVDESIDLTGTVTASARRDLSFGTSGVVKGVSVEAGDMVTSGVVLATLDASGLDGIVTKAEATLAKAKAQLETDQNGQSSTVAAATTGAASTSAPSSTKPTSPGSSSSGGVSPQVKAALAALTSQQSAVASAQTEATAAINTAKAALSAQAAACESFDTPPDDSGGSGTPSDDSDDEPSTSTGLSEECTAGLTAVQSAQDVVADKQGRLQAALQALTATLTKAVTALEKSGDTAATPSTGSGSSPSSTGSSPSGSSSSAGSSNDAPTTSSGSHSASSIAQDQAAIDTAEAELTEARLTAGAATLTAPFSGKVLSVSVSKGDTVATTDVVIVLVGDGETTATATVTIDQIADVERGQTASVTPSGAGPVRGTVTSIGLLPDSSTDTTTYPITIDLEEDTSAREGTTASISLVTDTVKDTLTVPSSAVSTTGRATVSVLKDGKITPTAVTVGIVGPTRTSITKGLTQGQRVVLADLDAVLPSGDSGTSGGFGGGRAGPGSAFPR